MPLKSNEDGSYVASWVPSTSGSYIIQVFIDGKSAGTCIVLRMYTLDSDYEILHVYAVESLVVLDVKCIVLYRLYHSLLGAHMYV